MEASDKDALTCDFAQYYKIYDLDRLDIEKLAILAKGLPSKARIYRSLSGQDTDLDRLILAGIFDRLNLLLFAFAGKKGDKAPESLVNKMMGNEEEEEAKSLYSSGEEFEKKRNELLKKIGGGNG